MLSSSLTEIILALIIGMTSGAVTYLVSLGKSKAERRMLEAEAERAQAETEKIREELKRQVTKQAYSLAEELSELESKKYSSIKQILHEYVILPGGLDFVAYIHKGTIYSEVATEQLRLRMSHLALKRSVKEQVDDYVRFAQDISMITDLANERLDELKQGFLFRCVFDVTHGGFIYYHVEDHNYLVGAVLEQSVMDDHSADTELRSMSRVLQRFVAEADM